MPQPNCLYTTRYCCKYFLIDIHSFIWFYFIYVENIAENGLCFRDKCVAKELQSRAFVDFLANKSRENIVEKTFDENRNGIFKFFFFFSKEIKRPTLKLILHILVSRTFIFFW